MIRKLAPLDYEHAQLVARALEASFPTRGDGYWSPSYVMRIYNGERSLSAVRRKQDAKLLEELARQGFIEDDIGCPLCEYTGPRLLEIVDKNQTIGVWCPCGCIFQDVPDLGMKILALVQLPPTDEQIDKARKELTPRWWEDK